MPEEGKTGVKEPLVKGGEKKGSSVSHSGHRTLAGIAALVLALLYFCGPESPLPDSVSTTLTVIILVPVILLTLQLIIVKSVVLAIHRFDQDYLGVDVEIEYLSLNIFVGRIQVKNMKVHNPPGYKGECLMKAENIVLDLDMGRAIKSKGMEIEVSELTMQGILANLEFDGYIYGKSNATTIVDHIKEASGDKSEIQPVYSYWSSANTQHTFHFDPPWSGEERLGCQFYAHKSEASGAEAIYDFWNSWYREHTFHFGDHGTSLDWKGNVQFYAYRKQAKDTEPVHEFWHVGNQEHTYHFLPAWDREEAGEVAFYAYRKDPTGHNKGKETVAGMKPVYDFWHSGQHQHQFHFLPAWGGEHKGKIHFYASTRQEPGMQPVYDFYIQAENKKTFHLGEPREGEERFSALFYVYTTPHPGCQPIYEFYHEKNKEFNIHAGDPWEGEEKREVMFYAHLEDPSKGRKLLLRKVALQGIKATSETKLVGASVAVDDISHEDFSREYEAESPEAIVPHLLDCVFHQVKLRLW